jgi:hypothetical protein
MTSDQEKKGKKILLYEYGYLDVVDEMLCTDDDDVGGIGLTGGNEWMMANYNAIRAGR